MRSVPAPLGPRRGGTADGINGALRKYIAAAETGSLRKRVVADFVNTSTAGYAAEPCDLLVFRLRNIHVVTRMLTESFTVRVLVFATEDD
jgi:hypothetical protein